VFGHIIHYCHPFRMVGCGLAIWVAATCMSGLAKSVGKYEFLFVARVLSGVGEASFQVCIYIYACVYMCGWMGGWMGVGVGVPPSRYFVGVGVVEMCVSLLRLGGG
jgi:hypothetical protein